ncbi:hypothetical protein [Aquimarina sp. Aq107]|uniref:hypothetical protein n=1 Tax=Aquimarina sp. Aq107 TaxID=1191912 RepID=UPI00131F2DC6|nr:hypothetical protein [Aquimarina sp. Aq107]
MLKDMLSAEGITFLKKDQKKVISGGINYENCDKPETWFYDMSSECEAYNGG